jgi:ABC-type Mn2+/Zn2+ transport system ATPase subunit
VSLGNVPIVESLNFEVDFPSIVVVKGDNGSGKSTFFNALRRKISHQGTCKINGKTADSQDFSYLGQSYSFSFPFLVKDFLRINAPNDEGDVIYQNILKGFDIDHLLDKSITQISQGQLQKCLIAQTLMQSSKVVLLDEPESFLDIKSKKQLCDLLKNYNVQTKKVLFVISHDQNVISEIAEREIVF